MKITMNEYGNKTAAANVNRNCGLCDTEGFANQIPLTWEEISNSVDGCPNCTLAIIRKLDSSVIHVKN